MESGPRPQNELQQRSGQKTRDRPVLFHACRQTSSDLHIDVHNYDEEAGRDLQTATQQSDSIYWILGRIAFVCQQPGVPPLLYLKVCIYKCDYLHLSDYVSVHMAAAASSQRRF